MPTVGRLGALSKTGRGPSPPRQSKLAAVSFAVGPDLKAEAFGEDSGVTGTKVSLATAGKFGKFGKFRAGKKVKALQVGSSE